MIEEVVIDDLERMSSFISEYTCSSNGVAGFSELIQLARVRNESITLLSLKDMGQVVAISLFQFSERRLVLLSYRSMYLYGFDFYDYNPFSVQLEYQSQFLEFIKKYAKSNHAKLVILENVIQRLRCKYVSENIQLFNSLKSVNGFDDIINKKRLNRYKKKLEESSDYSIRHYTGPEITEELIDNLVFMHQERWTFDNTQSPFINLKRKFDYLNHKENKVLTIVRKDDSILAIHYGMLFNNCLLFHTPVFNIKHYELSPYINFVELLILETVLYCNENNVEVLDFGLGDEIYKKKYMNDYKEVFTYYLPLDVFSSIIFNISMFIKSLDIKNRIMSFRNILYKIRYIAKKINVYEFNLDPLEKEESADFHCIKNYSEFVMVYRRIKHPVKRYHYNRFMRGDYFYCLLNNNNLYCSGWSTSKDMYVSEVNKILAVNGRVVLYDYYTPNKYRRKGKYQELLGSIISNLNTDVFIYALSNNLASNKAIRKVGFSKCKKDYLR
tara:strand:- start:22961 stop:24454 length:1494 start_codon:yes stop_codon:yes gene_type:complete